MKEKWLRAGTLAGIVALLPGAGCSSHSIREGVWEIRFNALDSLTRQPLPEPMLPPTKVLVEVEWSDEGETVGITDPERNLRMFGKIGEDGKKFYINGAMDDYWIFQLIGNVMNPERIDGTSFAARHRYERNTGIEGRWQMQHVRSE